MSRILVVGANGIVGSEVASLLGTAGHAVSRTTRHAPGAPDQVQVDVVTGRGLADAFTDVDAAFLMAPSGHAQQDALLRPMIDAATSAGLEKVVLMSAMGADADERTPLRKAERHLEASGLAWNVIRPNWFMQNFHTFWLHGIRTQATILLPVGAAKGSFIDTRDIAAAAARLLTSRDLDNRAFDLTGAEALDHDQVAAILSRATGRPIRFQDISTEAMREALLGAGLAADYTEFLLTILGYFKAGFSERTTDSVQHITGQAPRRFDAYSREHRAMWLA